MPKLIKGIGEKPKWSRRKKALVIGAAVIVVVIAAAGTYAYLSARPDGSGDESVVDTRAGSASATAAINQAQDKDNMGDVDSAVAILDNALVASPSLTDKTDILTVKATILANDGRTDDGVAAARQAISLDPHNPVLYKTLGSIYEVEGDTGKAVAAYKEGLANLEDGPKKQAQSNELNGAILRAQNDD